MYLKPWKDKALLILIEYLINTKKESRRKRHGFQVSMAISFTG